MIPFTWSARSVNSAIAAAHGARAGALEFREVVRERRLWRGRVASRPRPRLGSSASRPWPRPRLGSSAPRPLAAGGVVNRARSGRGRRARLGSSSQVSTQRDAAPVRTVAATDASARHRSVVRARADLLGVSPPAPQLAKLERSSACTRNDHAVSRRMPRRMAAGDRDRTQRRTRSRVDTQDATAAARAPSARHHLSPSDDPRHRRGVAATRSGRVDGRGPSRADAGTTRRCGATRSEPNARRPAWRRASATPSRRRWCLCRPGTIQGGPRRSRSSARRTFR